MPQTITEEEYNDEVRSQARELAEALEYEEHIDEPLEMIVDVLDAHSWFAGENLTGADYGAIISDYNEFSFPSDVMVNRDPESLTSGHDFDEILRRMAFGEFEADVLAAHSNNDFE